MRVSDLTGQDLAYWVAMANATGSRQARNIVRRHYGTGPSRHEPGDESLMRDFVSGKFGPILPTREDWP